MRLADLAALPLDPYEIAVYLEVRAAAGVSDRVELPLARIAEARRMALGTVRRAVSSLTARRLVALERVEMPNGATAPTTFVLLPVPAGMTHVVDLPPDRGVDTGRFLSEREALKAALFELYWRGLLDDPRLVAAQTALEGATGLRDLERVRKAYLGD